MTEVEELRDQLAKVEEELHELKSQHRHCETEVLSAKAETAAMEALLQAKHLGDVRTGDVLLVRYTKETAMAERGKDYAAIRNYFANTGVHPRIIGVGDNIDIDHLSEVEMAQYGWFKRRK